MYRRKVLFVACLCMLTMLACKAKEKPNVIIIITDDSGYTDFSCYGNKDWKTPNVDRIAKEGVKFTDGYVTESVCSPSRAGLMSGRYQQKFGHEMNMVGGYVGLTDESILGLPTSETLLPVHFKKQGYKTAAIGKWHLGETEKFHPNKRGFDFYYGMLGGGASYFEEKRGKNEPIEKNGVPQTNIPYLTDLFGEEAIKWIDDNKKDPFFMYLSFNAVHGPLQAKQEDFDKLPHIKDKKRRILGAMHVALDRQIGNLLDYLEKEKLDENTLIFFINDNGGPLDIGAINGNLRGRKGTCMEGGIRVPYMMKWPGKIKPNTEYTRPVSALDIFATSLAVIGADTTGVKMDGVNLLPYLDGKKKEDPHKQLFWRRQFYAAIREGDWKLVRLRDRSPMLFNLKEDVNERNDLSQTHREKVDYLMQQLFNWENTLTYPLWRTKYKYLKENTLQHDQLVQDPNKRPKPLYIQ